MQSVKNTACGAGTLLAALVSMGVQAAAPADKADRLRPWPESPHYLAWGDVPVFPLGATGHHGWTPISRPGTVASLAQLERLGRTMAAIDSPHVCGFVRCLPYDPMNHQHDGHVEEVLQPWVRLEDGRYDLTRFVPRWERRLREFLDKALEHRIVVSVEVWDDWSVTRGPGGAYDPEGFAWNAHPFHPKNNVNYGPDTLPAATSVCDAPFYSTIPARGGNEPVLKLQKRYVDHLLGIVAGYPNVWINIANESRAHLDWSRFWAKYIRERVPNETMIGDMPSSNRKDGGGECEHAFNPLTLSTDSRYDFVDIAQAVSRHEFGSPRAQALGAGARIHGYRAAMAEAGTRRPLVVSKDYTNSPDGGDMVLWSRFVAGAAAARFHRPAGNAPASVVDFQHAAVERLGRFIAQVSFWRMRPAPERLVELPRGARGANILAAQDGQCVVQLIGGEAGGTLMLKLPNGAWSARWMDPTTGTDLAGGAAHSEAGAVQLEVPPGPEHRIAHVVRKGG